MYKRCLQSQRGYISSEINLAFWLLEVFREFQYIPEKKEYMFMSF